MFPPVEMRIQACGTICLHAEAFFSLAPMREKPEKCRRKYSGAYDDHS